MLARLEQIDGVLSAEVDEAGDHLRLAARDDHGVEAALAALESLGYGAERADASEHLVRWFGAGSVRELSRIEAGVIADRVLPQLNWAGAPADIARLRAATVEALYACFAATDLTSAVSGQAFRADCVRQTVAAATPIVGAALANELGRLLDADMRQVH